MAVDVIRSANFGEVLQRIRKEHQPNRWLYRGQIYRRPVHHLVAEGQSIEVENLYPGSFRFASQHSTVAPAFEEEWSREHTKARALFHAFNSFLTWNYERARETGATRFAWMDSYYEQFRKLFQGPGDSVFSGFHEKGLGWQNPEFVRLCWSLAQHYEVITSLLDFTFDPNVAAWFAINSWKAEGQSSQLEGDATVYRIQTDNVVAATVAFNKIFLSHGPTNQYAPPPDQIFAQNLRDIPPAFALRPTRQQAAVVAGFDDLRFLRMICGTDVLTAFVFPHVPDERSRWPLDLTREYLIPLDDPFDDLKNEFETKWAQQASAWIGKAFTKPIVILTEDGPKFASNDPATSDTFDSLARSGLYLAIVHLLEAGQFDKAATQSERLIAMPHPAGIDALSIKAYLTLGTARQALGDFESAADAFDNAFKGLKEYPSMADGDQVIEAAVEGAARLDNKGQSQSALLLLGKALDIGSRRAPTEMLLNATARTIFLIGLIQLKSGNTESGIKRLREVVERFGGGADYQRVFVAAAFQTMAAWHEARSDRQQARELYEKIIDQFAHETGPDIHRILNTARRGLARNS